MNNSYVVNKFKVIVAPFLHSNWERSRPSDPSSKTPHAAPREDINAPDLYIPAMALVSYVLVVCFLKGTGNTFHPEVLGMTTTAAVALLGFEVAAFKLALYILNIPSPVPIPDLCALCGYKYVLVIASVLVREVLGDSAYYLAVLYSGVAAGMLIVKSLRRVVAVDNGVVPVYGEDGPGRGGSYFLVFMAAVQLPLVWFDSRV